MNQSYHSAARGHRHPENGIIIRVPARAAIHPWNGVGVSTATSPVVQSPQNEGAILTLLVNEYQSEHFLFLVPILPKVRLTRKRQTSIYPPAWKIINYDKTGNDISSDDAQPYKATVTRCIQQNSCSTDNRLTSSCQHMQDTHLSSLHTGRT